MKNSENSKNIKEKAKLQIDYIIEKKPIDKIKLPLPLRLIAVLFIVQCVLTAPVTYINFVDFIESWNNKTFEAMSTSSIILNVTYLLGLTITIALMIAIGVNMLLNRRRVSAILSTITSIIATITAACNIMVEGIEAPIYILTITIILLVVLKSYIDPSLSKERKLHKKIHDNKIEDEAKKGTLGFDEKSGRPKLNFFNIFWLFFIMCIVGYIWEIIWHMTVDNPGVYEERAGFLFGPFSPIYGFGAVIITLILYKFSNKNIIIIFIVSALLGGFFEYFVSLYLETCFGVRSWDYSHLPFNINGRTSLRFFIIWGVIGVLWIKLLMKPLFKLVNKIPWKLRYSLTIIASAFMLVNMIMTFQALDCWYTRNAGKPPITPIEQFYDKYFNDDFMHQRFENMKMNPESAIRGSNNS